MVLLKKIRVMAAKVETTPGTAETLTASEGAYNAYDIDIQANIAVETREAQGAFNKLSSVPGARVGTLSFKTDLLWDGTTTLPNWASVLMLGCGWKEASQVLNPVSEAPGSNVKTLTLAVYENGLKKTLAGAMGTFRLVCPTGRRAFLEFTFTGVWQPVTDTAIVSPTYPTDTPIRYASAVSTFNSVNLCVESVTFDAGNNVVLKECASTAAGFDYAIVTDRTPTITCNPESTLVATQDRFGAWLASTEAEFSITLDAVSDATLEVSAPKAQIINLQEGDRNMVQIDDITFQCNKNGATADQELQFTFTEAT